MQGSVLPQFGLYAVTDRDACRHHGIVQSVRYAIRGGARIVQYRDKSQDSTRREDEARKLLDLCRTHNVPLIINDDATLAAKIGADGVHLGRGDMSLIEARRLLGPDVIIGVSCYHELERALQAQSTGADYVAFGRFFPSRNKPGPALATPGLLSRARDELTIPVAAIGGIDASNATELLEAGATHLACIHSVFGQPDIEAAARALQSLFP